MLPDRVRSVIIKILFVQYTGVFVSISMYGTTDSKTRKRARLLEGLAFILGLIEHDKANMLTEAYKLFCRNLIEHKTEDVS